MSADRTGARIVVIDDDADARLLADAVLRAAGYEVLTDDGAAGLARRLLDARPSLLLLDLHLDGRNAGDVLEEIAQHRALGGVPVVGCTGSGIDDRLLRRIRPRLAAVVHKPLEPQRVADAVRCALAFGPLPALPADDPEIAALRTRFVEGLPDRIARIREAADRGDRNALVHEVHRLRGAAAGFAFHDVAALAGALERELREGRSGDPESLLQAARAISGRD